MHAESVLASALEIHGTTIALPVEGGEVVLYDLTNRCDVEAYMACRPRQESDATTGWIIDAMTQMSQSIEERGDAGTMVCNSKSGTTHILNGITMLGMAVSRLPKSETADFA